MKLVIPTLGQNSVLLIGDVHGFTSTYHKLIKRLPPGQRSIQLGDMACGFKHVGIHRMPDSHTWFRGNHDNPTKSRAHVNYRGDYGYDAETQIFHIAGAWSIDRDLRTQGFDWWPDEQLSYSELDQVIELYRQTKPRFVVSHEAPAKAGATLLYSLMTGRDKWYYAAKMDCTHSRTAEAMQQMLDSWQPEKWCFGHYHADREFFTPGYDTKFICIGGMMESGEPPHVYELKLN